MDVKNLIKKAERSLYRIVEDRQFWTPEFCRAFFDWCDQQAYEFPDAAIRRGDLALELARKTGDDHVQARAHGVMASAYRMRSLYSMSEGEFTLSFQRAGSCSCCLADTYRRQGISRMYQLKIDSSITLYDKALAHYTEIGDDDGIGRTLVSKGISLWRLDRIYEALEHERAALRMLAPDTPTVYHVAALTNTAQFLVAANEEEFAFADEYCIEFRDYLAGREGFTFVRVRLSWSHGLILLRLGERKRGLQMLRKARKALMRARHDAEVIAITADIIYAYCDSAKYHFIVEIINDTIEKLGNVQGARALLEKILHAADWKLEETREHSSRLRKTVNVSVPFLLSADTKEAFLAP